ncbi:MAG: hypothetical protein ACE5JP_13770 [Candidatus Bipolaricaulia bacterium]
MSVGLRVFFYGLGAVMIILFSFLTGIVFKIAIALGVVGLLILIRVFMRNQRRAERFLEAVLGEKRYREYKSKGFLLINGYAITTEGDVFGFRGSRIEPFGLRTGYLYPGDNIVARIIYLDSDPQSIRRTACGAGPYPPAEVVDALLQDRREREEERGETA